jgi:predicted dehydrogenase
MKNQYDRRNFINLVTGRSEEELSAALIQKKKKESKLDPSRPIRLGFIGVGGRGSFHLMAALGIPGVEIPAICDIKPTRLYNAKRFIEESGFPSPRLYDRGPEDFRRLCAEEDLDAIICSTSWEWHAPICLEAMRNDIHAVTEVPIVQTVDEAWEIVETYEKTGKWASLGLQGFRELAVLNMINKGMFGEVVHIENGYVHDLRHVKFTPDEEPWRLQHSIERNGNLYPDHPMTKILPAMDINHGDRFDFLVSMSSSSVMINRYAALNFGENSHYAKAKVALGDYNATLIRTVNGKMVTLNHDTNTPHPREEYRLQGTKGIYLSDQLASHIYLEGYSPIKVPHHQAFEPAEKYLTEYAHPIEKNYNPAPRRPIGKIVSHGQVGAKTPMVWERLVNALRENKMPDWDVYDSVTSSVISPLTEKSIAGNCSPIDFPDFTKGKWKKRPRINLV